MLCRANPISYAACMYLAALVAASSSIRASGSETLYTTNITKGTVVQFGSGVAPSTYASGLTMPTGLAFNSLNDLFVAGRKGSITEIKPGGLVSNFVTLTTSNVGTLPGSLEGVAFNSNNDLFVATGAHLIVEVTPGGTVSEFASTILFNPSSSLFGVAVNSQGDVFASDQITNDVYEFSPTGSLINTIVDPADIKNLNGIAFDRNGTLFAVGENATTSVGEVVEIPLSGPDVILAAGVTAPEDVVVDGAGNLFVLAGNDKVSEIPEGGSASLIVSSGLTGGSFLAVAPTPEPTALTLFFAAGVSAATVRRRRKNGCR